MKFIYILSSFILIILHYAQARVEPASKSVFSDRRDGLELAGLGIRKKGPVNVYSVALYAAKAPCMRECKNCDRNKIATKLAQGNYAKEIVLKMSRSVGAEKMAVAISDAIAPRMKGKDTVVLNRQRSYDHRIEWGMQEGHSLVL